MRPIIISVCLFAAACGQGVDSPTSPTTATVATIPTQAKAGAQLPFTGSFTADAHSTFVPPVTLRIDGTAVGTATHLGRFTATYVDVVDTTTATATGTFTFTAANGDQLVATTAGGEDAFIPPNVSRTTLVAMIVSGTGRFAGATGTVTMHSVMTIDFAAGTSTGSGSFEGHLNLNE